MKVIYEQLRLKEQKRSFLFQEVDAIRFDHPWHFHPELELTWIIEGAGVRYVGDHIEHFESDDLILIGKGLPHQWNSYQHEKSSHAYVLQFKQEDLMMIQEMNLLIPLFEDAKYGLSYRINDELKELFVRLEEGNRLERLSTMIYILEVLRTKAARKLSKRTYNWDSNKSEKSQFVITYIQEHLDENMTVGKMAEKSNMSPPSFCRWFKQMTGKSFVEFVNSSRIENSTFLLSQSQKPISEIAFEVGFNSISQFNRSFKKVKKKSPSEWRKMGA